MEEALFIAGLLVTYDPDLFFLSLVGIFVYAKLYRRRLCEQ